MMAIAKMSQSTLQRICLLLGLLLCLLISRPLVVTSVTTNGTAVQNPPLLTNGQNAANAAANQGSELQNTVNQQTQRAQNQLPAGDHNEYSANPMDEVTGAQGFINDDQTVNKIMNATNKLANSIAQILINGAQAIALITFICGIVALAFGVWRSRNRWGGLTMMLVGIVVMVLASHTVEVFNWFCQMGNNLF